MFVGIEREENGQSNGLPFFLAEVIDMERQAAQDGTFTVLWNEPQMRRGEANNPKEFHQTYFTFVNRSWIPLSGPNDRVPRDSIITAWTNSAGLSNLTTIDGVRIGKQIMVPMSQKYHLRVTLEFY
jgi:hypothetical protein